MDPEQTLFLQGLQFSHPLPGDPNDLAAFVNRYEAVSNVLPEPPELLKVTSGAFHLNVLACGEKTRIEARLYMPDLPKTAAKPELMAFFHGGGWVAGSLASHDGLCRQLCADLKVAIASVHVTIQPEYSFIEPAEQALQVLLTLCKATFRSAQS